MSWETLVKIGHIVGTVLGVGGATFAAVFYFKSLRVGGDNPLFASMQRTAHLIVRLGTALLVISGFGYLLLLRFEGQTQHIYGPRVWAKMIITLIILVNAILMQSRRISFAWGGAISFTSWYAALIIGAWRMHASFWTLMLVYALCVVAAYFVQNLITKRIKENI